MHDPNNLDPIVLEAVNHPIGKTFWKSRSCLLIPRRVALRVGLNVVDERPYLIQKFQAQTFTSFFIPLKSMGEVALSLRANYDPVGHLVREAILLYTTSQGDPALGLRRRASSRSSIKALSSGVKSIPSGAAAILSQISSTSCSRSDTGS
jgi:hypothetical protein